MERINSWIKPRLNKTKSNKSSHYGEIFSIEVIREIFLKVNRYHVSHFLKHVKTEAPTLLLVLLSVMICYVCTVLVLGKYYDANTFLPALLSYMLGATCTQNVLDSLVYPCLLTGGFHPAGR